MLNGRRRAGIGVVIAAAALTFVSAAFACNPVASIKLGSSAAPPGEQVKATGDGFSNSHGGAPNAEPVVVRWDSRTGPVLWSGRPDATGAISFTFTVPSATPGDHNVIATQTNADGTPAPGTPARAVLTVLEPPPTTTTSTTTTTTVATPPSSMPPSSMPAVEATALPAAASTVPPLAAPTTVVSVRQTATRAAPTTTAKSAATAPPSTDAIVVTVPPTTTPSTSLAPPSTDTSAPSGTALVAQEAFSDDGGSGTSAPVLLGVVLLGSLAASVGGMRRVRARRSE